MLLKSRGPGAKRLQSWSTTAGQKNKEEPKQSDNNPPKRAEMTCEQTAKGAIYSKDDFSSIIHAKLANPSFASDALGFLILHEVQRFRVWN